MSAIRLLPLLLILSAPVLCDRAEADKVYKWVDADGSVHFGDRRGAPAAEELEVRVPRPPAAPATAQSDTTVGEVPISEDRDEACRKARTTLQSYVKAPFLYEEVDGKRRILSAEERERIQDQARQAVEQACSPGAP